MPWELGMLGSATMDYQGIRFGYHRTANVVVVGVDVVCLEKRGG